MLQSAPCEWILLHPVPKCGGDDAGVATTAAQSLKHVLGTGAGVALTIHFRVKADDFRLTEINSLFLQEVQWKHGCFCGLRAPEHEPLPSKILW
jgi:hypothetical protein